MSEGLISEWFKRRWQFNASKKKTSNVPTDKWSDANTQRCLEYLAKMLWMDPKRVKFCDDRPARDRARMGAVVLHHTL